MKEEKIPNVKKLGRIILKLNKGNKTTSLEDLKDAMLKVFDKKVKGLTCVSEYEAHVLLDLLESKMNKELTIESAKALRKMYCREELP